MIIQLNADNNLSIHESFREKLTDTLTAELERFSEQITRLEVHLSDENGNKRGVDDKRCLLEARLAGMQPIAVTEFGDTYENSLNGAVEKLKAVLDKTFERLKSH